MSSTSPLLSAPVALAVSLVFAAPSSAQQSIQAPERHDLAHVAPLLSFLPAPGATLEHGALLGDWREPSLVQTGSMSARLLDQEGQVEYDVHAVVSEFVALGSGTRFGGIRGRAEPSPFGLPIEVVGSWVIDLAENRGTFELELYLGGFSPTAPLLSLGTAEGRIGKPEGLSAGGGAGVFPGGSGAPPAPGVAASQAAIQAQAGAQRALHPGASSTAAGSPGGVCTAGGEILEQRAHQVRAAGGVPATGGAPAAGVAGSGSSGAPAAKGGISAEPGIASGSASVLLGTSGSGSGGAGAPTGGPAGSSQLVVRSLNGRWTAF